VRRDQRLPRAIHSSCQAAPVDPQKVTAKTSSQAVVTCAKRYLRNDKNSGEAEERKKKHTRGRNSRGSTEVRTEGEGSPCGSWRIFREGQGPHEVSVLEKGKSVRRKEWQRQLCTDHSPHSPSPLHHITWVKERGVEECCCNRETEEESYCLNVCHFCLLVSHYPNPFYLAIN